MKRADNIMAGTEILVGSMKSLCPSARSLLGIIIMMIFIVSFSLFVFRIAIERSFKENRLLARLSPKLKALAIVGFALAVFGFIIYLSVPFVINYLIQGTGQNPYDSNCFSTYQYPPCNNTGNQTCIIYAMKPLGLPFS